LEAARQHSDLFAPLDVWYRVAKKADWETLNEVRRTFPAADAVGKYTVFNIKGNLYRLIVEINYRSQRVFIRHVLTHAEYDRGRWKQ
jgi:mRNA interferase HigB